MDDDRAGEGRRLRCLRRRTGLSRTDFALFAGVRYDTLRCWELGKYRVGDDALMRMCRKLAQLLGEQPKALFEEVRRDGPST